MKRRGFIKNVSGAAAAVWARPRFGFGDGAPAKPNIVFIMCDQWRKHSLGFMNQDHVLTPNLDALAARSAVFTNAISTVPVCGPNRACLFSGKYSVNNGVLANESYLMPEHYTIGEICRDAGYQTAYIGKWHLGATSGAVGDIQGGYTAPDYRHGFEFWYNSKAHQPFDQPFFIGGATKVSKPVPYFAANPDSSWATDHEAQIASNYVLGRDRTKPFCMVLSFAPPHTGGGKGLEDRFNPADLSDDGEIEDGSGYGYKGPSGYEAPYINGGSQYHRPVRPNYDAGPLPLFEESKCVQGYFGAITAIDNSIRMFLETLESEGLMDNTIIVITADHGESMGSHGKMTKGNWFQESSGIPGIFYFPPAVSPASYSNVFNSIDFLPTICGLAGLPAPVDIDGTDFAPLLRGEPMTVPQYAFGSYFRGGSSDYDNVNGNGWRNWRAIYTERYTYVQTHGNYVAQSNNKTEVIYDRQVDPYELNPVSTGMGQNPLLKEFRAMMAEHLEKLGDPFTVFWDARTNVKNTDWSYYQRIVEKTFDFPAAGSPVDAWRKEKFGAAANDPAFEATLWGDAADPDGDGVPNLIEFITGTDPLSAVKPSYPKIVAGDNGRIKVRYRQSKRARADSCVKAFFEETGALGGAWKQCAVNDSLYMDLGDAEIRDAELQGLDAVRFVRLSAQRKG